MPPTSQTLRNVALGLVACALVALVGYGVGAARRPADPPRHLDADDPDDPDDPDDRAAEEAEDAEASRLGGAPMALRFVADAEARGAVCSNGSPGAYYIREGDPSTWVIVVAGTKSGGCETARSCQALFERAPHFLATRWEDGGEPRSIPPTRHKLGILSDDPDQNPHLHTATHVLVYACSNDLFLGDVPASEATGGWHFRGRRILAGVLRDLADRPRAPITEAEAVLLVGSNSGVEGVCGLLDDPELDDRIDALPLHVFLAGRHRPSFRPDGWEPDTARRRARFARQGIALPPRCAAAHGDADRCYSANARCDGLPRHTFVHVAQRDVAVTRLIAGRDPSPAEVRALRDSVRDGFPTLFPPEVGLFLPDTTWHRRAVMQSKFNDHRIVDPADGAAYTMADALDAWMRHGRTPRLIERP